MAQVFLQTAFFMTSTWPRVTSYLSGSANETLNDGLNDRLKSTYGIIKANPGIQGKKIAELSGKSVPTIDRHIADLMQRGLIERRGSKKTGGYYAL